jgi:S-(hydroxymethyl)glutathione dehydrogenase/alcohol dehydrogenase
LNSRAAVFWAPGEPFTIEEIELAEPGPHDVLIRMKAVGICGTDLHQVKGEFLRPTPMVLGHEGAGVVEAVGDSVTRVGVGDEVVLSWAASCRECEDCRRGRPARCTRLHAALGAGTLVGGETGMSLRGETVYRGTATGALSERLVVDEQLALPTGGAIPLDQAALLGCAALTGTGAVRFAAGVEQGAIVLVVGAGGVGQFCVQGARIAGASTIVCVDPSVDRLERAKQLGATDVAHPDDLAHLMADVAPTGADYAFDAVGDPATTATALGFTRAGGTAVIVGLPAAGRRLDLDPAEFIRREKRLTGTMYGSEDPAVALTTLIEDVREGRLELESMIGGRHTLESINEAVEESLAGDGGRVLVEV